MIVLLMAMSSSICMRYSDIENCGALSLKSKTFISIVVMADSEDSGSIVASLTTTLSK